MGSLGTVALVLGILDQIMPKRPRPAVVIGHLGQIDPLDPQVRNDPEKMRTVRVRTIEDRIKLIKNLIRTGGLDPQVRSLSHSVLNRKCGGTWCIPEKDQKGEVAAIFQAVRERVRYVSDPLRRDTYVTPARTLFSQMGGDCDDSAAALGAMLESVGYTVRLRVVQTQGYDSWNHIYNVVQIPATGEWIVLDASQNKPAGWEVPANMIIHKRDFEV